MSIAPAALLVPYLVGLLAFGVIGTYALYKLLRSGAPSAGSWLMTSAFAIGTLAVVATSLWQLTAIDWASISVSVSGNPVANYGYPTLD